jgi:hypothetical protein
MADYWRYSNSDTGIKDVPWMMLAADRETVCCGYGQYAYRASDTGAVDASSLVDAAAEGLADCDDSYLRDNAQDIAALISPSSIVDSAGLWDCADAVQVVWDKVLEPRGIMAVRTPDGLIVFDSTLVERV